MLQSFNKQKETDLIKEGMLLCEYLNIKPEILTFMLKVFKELEFIYDEKGLIKINPTPNKQDIENSRIYQMRQARMEVEERLSMMIFKYKRMDNIKVNIAFRRKTMDLKQYVSEVKDWPSAGVSFKDITTIMDNGEAYGYATDQIVEYAKEKI